MVFIEDKKAVTWLAAFLGSEDKRKWFFIPLKDLSKPNWEATVATLSFKEALFNNAPSIGADHKLGFKTNLADVNSGKRPFSEFSAIHVTLLGIDDW